MGCYHVLSDVNMQFFVCDMGCYEIHFVLNELGEWFVLTYGDDGYVDVWELHFDVVF